MTNPYILLVSVQRSIRSESTLVSRLSVLLSAALVLLVSLTGCGASNGPTPLKSGDPTSSEPQTKPNNPNKQQPGKNPTCKSDTDCIGFSSYCRPSASGSLECQVITTQNDGESCTRDDDCTGGTCLKSAPWVFGYCTTIGCTKSDDCASIGGDITNLCLQHPNETSYCVRKCASDEACRDGYSCQTHKQSSNIRICLPKPLPPKPTKPAAELTPVCTPVSGKSEITLKFNIPKGTKSYQLLTWIPTKMGSLTPDRVTVNNRDVNPHTWHRDSMSIISLPMAPNEVSWIEEGTVQVTMKLNQASQICSLLHIKREPGTILDLNMILVGVKKRDYSSVDLTPEEAAKDPDIKEFIKTLRAIYQRYGITIRHIRFSVAPPDIVKEYSILRVDTNDYSNFHKLVRSTELPGFTYDEQMSLNVFLVQSLIGTLNAAGISSAVPGAAGLHGTDFTGVVATTGYLRSSYGTLPRIKGSIITATTIAHEIGHFLGLYHTTEKDGKADPLPDTPQCARELVGGSPSKNCPDYSNLMFWSAGDMGDTDGAELTPQQLDVIRSHPLLKVPHY